MIVVDTSALMAVVGKEDAAPACSAALADAAEVLISAGTLAEALIVSAMRGVSADMTELINGFPIRAVALTSEGAHLVEAAYARWGKGVHPAGLNLADCFAYALAKERDAALLYVGNDFVRTDIRSALA